MIEIVNLSKSYTSRETLFSRKKIDVLKNLNMKIPLFSFSVLCGENGIGKTTLLKILSSYIYPDNGNIFIDKVKLNSYSKNNRIILVLSDERNFYYRLSILQNLEFFLRIFKIKKNKKKILEILELFGLLSKKDSFYYELSTGLKQRLALVRALLLEPKLLLLDEIEKGIDLNMLDYIFKYLINMKNEISIIYTSHQKALINKADFIFEL